MRALLSFLIASGLFAAFASASPQARTVTGRVVAEATGLPVAGARVSLFFRPPGEEGPSEPALRKHVERRDGVAGADGRFAVEVPPAAAGSVGWIAGAPGLAEKAGLGFQGESPFVPLGPKGAELAIALAPGRTIAGKIVDERGGPVADARVRMTLSGPGWCSWPHARRVGELQWPDPVKSSAEGTFEILGFPWEEAREREGARWLLTVEDDALAPAVVQTLEALPAHDGIVDVRVVMRPGTTISGTVTDVAGRPVPRARVEATAGARADEPACVQLESATRASEDGSFTLGGLDGRAYTLVARARGYAPAPEVKASGGARGITVTLREGRTLRGRVADSRGAAVAGLVVNVMTTGPRVFETAETDAEGRFAVADLPDGPAKIAASDTFEREVVLPSPEVEIRLPARRDVRVTLRQAESGELLESGGSLYWTGAMVSSYMTIGVDGRATLPRMATGRYTLYADVPGRALAEAAVEIPEGDGAYGLTLDVRKGFVLSGRVVDEAGRPIAGAKVTASGGPYDARSTVTDADGRYTIAGLNDARRWFGSWYLLAAAAPGRAAAIDLETFARVSLFRHTKNFVLGPGGSVRGRVTRADGTPAAGLLVRVVHKQALYSAQSAALPQAVTDDDGAYELEHVPGGTATITIGSETAEVRIRDGGTHELNRKLGR